MTKFKGFIKRVVCNSQFERRYVGKVESEPTFYVLLVKLERNYQH